MLPNLAVYALAIDPFLPSTIYAGTGEGIFNIDSIRGAGIFKTADGGQTWKSLDVTGVGVFWSDDGGESWALVLDRNLPNIGCPDLVLRRGAPGDYLFAACGIGDTDIAIFRNPSAGSDSPWEAVLTNDNLSRSVIAVVPSNPSIV